MCEPSLVLVPQFVQHGMIDLHHGEKLQVGAVVRIDFCGFDHLVIGYSSRILSKHSVDVLWHAI